MRKAYSRLINRIPFSSIPGVAAIILAAGRGQRLAPFTAVTPKPLLPILNLPILLWTTSSLQRAGFSDVCMNLHYMPDAFREAIRICGENGLRLRSVCETSPTGPLGGAISCRSSLPESEACIILSGDALFDIDFAALLAAHRASQSDLTLTVAQVSDGWRYGVLEIDSCGFVKGMREKPSDVRPIEHVSCGVYVISTRRLVQLRIPESTPYDFVDLVSNMLSAGHSVATYATSGWRDVGSPDDLLDANLAYLGSSHLASMASPEWRSSTGDVWSDSPRPIPKRLSVIGRALVASDAVIESDVVLVNAVVGSRASIRAGARVVSSLVLPGGTVPAGAEVSFRVVGP